MNDRTRPLTATEATMIATLLVLTKADVSAEARDSIGRWTSGSHGPLDLRRPARPADQRFPAKRTLALSMKQIRETEDTGSDDHPLSADWMISHLAHHDPQEVAGALRAHVTKLARTLELHQQRQQRTLDPAGSRKMYLTAEDWENRTLRDVKNSENPRFPRELELHQAEARNHEDYLARARSVLGHYEGLEAKAAAAQPAAAPASAPASVPDAPPADTSPVIGQSGTGMGTPDATGWLKPRIHPDTMTLQGTAQRWQRPRSRWRIDELGFVKPLLMPGGTGSRRYRPAARAIIYHFGALRGEPGGSREWAWGYDTRLHPDHGTHIPEDRSWIKGYARNQRDAKAAAERELPNHIDAVESVADRPWAERLAEFEAHAGDQARHAAGPGAVAEAIARNHPTLQWADRDLAWHRSLLVRNAGRLTATLIQRETKGHQDWERAIARTRASIPAMLADLRAKAHAESLASPSASRGGGVPLGPALPRHPVATPVPAPGHATGIASGSVIATGNSPVSRARGEAGTR